MSDHKYFNCSEQHEHDYVARQYAASHRPRVRQFLKDKCDDGTIRYNTHNEVYQLIKKELGLSPE